MIGLLYGAIWPIPNSPIQKEIIPRGNNRKEEINVKDSMIGLLYGAIWPIPNGPIQEEPPKDRKIALWLATHSVETLILVLTP